MSDAATMLGDAPTGATAEEDATVGTAKAAHTKKFDEAAAILKNPICNEQVHSEKTLHDDLVALWNRSKEQFERVSEAETNEKRKTRK